MDYDLIQRVLSEFEREHVRYVVFGAAALNFHGLSRFTEDLDVFIAPDAENVERLKRALQTVFDDPHIDEISAADLMGEYPAVQYGPPRATGRTSPSCVGIRDSWPFFAGWTSPGRRAKPELVDGNGPVPSVPAPAMGDRG